MARLFSRSRRFYAWVLFSGFVVRPYFAGLNAETRRVWGCPGIVDGPHNTTGLEVIVAGLGRSGTHGMGMALEMLGLRTYGTFESVFYMPDVYRKSLRQEHLVFMMRSCRVKAFIIEPHYDLLWKLLPVSPEARVILTTRDYESWKSANLGGTRVGWGYYLNFAYTASLLLMNLLCDWVPYAPIWRLAGGRGHSFMQGSLATLLLEHCGQAGRGWQVMTQNYVPDWNAAMIMDPSYFRSYHENVRFFVPRERLLEFDIKRQGWAELASFLQRPPPSSGPLPRTGSGSAHFTAMRLQAHPARWLLFWALLALTVLANWLAFGLLWALLGGCWACTARCCCASGRQRAGQAATKEE